MDIKFSDQADAGFTGGVDHAFRKQCSDKSLLVIDRSLNLFAGTHRFANAYYKKSGLLFLPGVGEVISEDVKKIRILSYEFSMPVFFLKEKI